MIGRIILMGSCDLNLRMGGRIDISNREREWPGNNDSPNEHLVVCQSLWFWLLQNGNVFKLSMIKSANRKGVLWLY